MTESRARYVIDLPAGIERTVLRIVSQYTAERSISRGQLVADCRRMGFPKVSERVVREAIKQLRRQGHLICSAPGVDGGYYLARSKAEYHTFREAEYMAKIADMRETVTAMDAAAAAQFGDGYQTGLWG